MMNNVDKSVIRLYPVVVSLFLLFSLVHAAPKDPISSDYNHILSQKPFHFLKEKNTLNTGVGSIQKREQFVLKGVTKMSTSWLVVIASKANPAESIILRSGRVSKDGIEILQVLQNKLDYRQTKVRLKAAGREYTVQYNQASLIKASPAVMDSKGKPSQQNPVLNNRKNPTQVLTPNSIKRARPSVSSQSENLDLRKADPFIDPARNIPTGAAADKDPANQP